MRFLIVAAIVVCGAGTAAATAFERVHGGRDLDRGVFVAPTRDGGYVVVGVTKSFGEGDEDVYLVKTDAEGLLQWTRTYGGKDLDYGWSVYEAADGYLLAGFTRSFGAGGWDFYLVKTDPEGELVWSRTYGGEGDDRCWALIPATEGGFVLAGETTSSGDGKEDFFLVRTDSTGVELWSRTYGGQWGDRCFAIAQTADGGFMLVGQTYSEGAGDRDVYIVKTGAEGEAEWTRTFGGEASDVGHCVIRAEDGDFLVTGYTTSLAIDGDDPFLIKINARGDTQWTRVLSLAGINHTITGAQATDGGYYLVGFSEHPTQGAVAACLVKTDPDGHLAWNRDVLLTDSGQTFGYTIRATADGGCVFTGHTTVGSAGDLDLLLVKVADEKR